MGAAVVNWQLNKKLAMQMIAGMDLGKFFIHIYIKWSHKGTTIHTYCQTTGINLGLAVLGKIQCGSYPVFILCIDFWGMFARSCFVLAAIEPVSSTPQRPLNERAMRWHRSNYR